MDLQARTHALEILVEVFIATLPAEQRLAVARAFSDRAEVVRSAMSTQSISEEQQQEIDENLARLSNYLNWLATR
jgi:hypothetical protein